MIYIGIIVWALLVVAIIELTSPGFVLLVVVLSVLSIGLRFLIEEIYYRSKNKRK